MLFGTKAAEFLSDYPLEESVNHLSAVVKRSVFSALTKQELVGRVSLSKVSVQRVVPFFGNSFKPFFIGAFQIKDGKVVLSGNFTIHPFTKVFMTLWLGFCIFFILMGMIVFFDKNQDNAFIALGGVGFMLFGVGLIRFCQWISHGDVEWISTKIARALSSRSEAESVTDTQDSKTWLERNWKMAIPIGIAMLLILITGFFFLITTIISSSSPYADALALAKSNPEVIKVLGEPIKDGFFASGHTNVSNSSGDADWVIPISGPKGKATVNVRATRLAGKWGFDTLEVKMDNDNERVNLLLNKQ